MDSEDVLRSFLPFLPLTLRSSSLFWSPAVLDTLKSLSKGPTHSNVNSGKPFALALDHLRNSLGYRSLHPSASLGFSLFFDDLMSKNEAKKWFEEVVPRLVDLLLRLPTLLETHYDGGIFNEIETGLRLLESQQPGIVFLSQELIAALLVCALFCLFPTSNRGAKHLPNINFDDLFACLYECNDVYQEHKIKCLVHYFEKICSNMPVGNVSFERKVLPLKNSLSNISYPEPEFWSKSNVSLCPLEVHTCGMIEDQPAESLEVDFANKYIGGGALSRGCVQEEIRFMINPELIVSMLFLSSMADNEAIEIVGAERFSNYSGYAKSFRFSGDCVDKKSVDTMGRRKTRIIAIDALCDPGKRQYRVGCLLREANKALCGFFDQKKLQKYKMLFEESGTKQSSSGGFVEADNESSNEESMKIVDEIGIATGNWGCGAFGGDPEVKAVIQWLAASQSLRPFILYCTFDLEPLRKLEKIVTWVLSQGWTVGEVWNLLVEYSTQRVNGETRVGLFSWLLPDKAMDLDVP